MCVMFEATHPAMTARTEEKSSRIHWWKRSEAAVVEEESKP